MKKADNFDANKWLTENKITTQSRLNEDEEKSKIKVGDKFNGGFVLASNDDNDILDTEFPELLALSTDKGVTKENFVIIAPIEPEYGENFGGKQFIYLINNSKGKIQIKNPSSINKVYTSYKKGVDIFDVIDIDVIQPDIEKYSSNSSELSDEPGIGGYKGGVGFKTGRQEDKKYTKEQKENYLKYLKKKADEGNQVAKELFKIAKTLPEVQPFLK